MPRPASAQASEPLVQPACASGECPMVQLLDLLAGKWSFPVLYRLILQKRPVRFSELQRLVGRITQKELTKHLRQFEALGLVEREVFPEVPPRVEYVITDFGRSLKKPLDALALWVNSNREAIAQASSRAA
jgi:DNA-binding HxlR family transcriptional regulator